MGIRDIARWTLKQPWLVLQFKKILPGSWGEAGRRLKAISDGAFLTSEEADFLVFVYLTRIREGQE